MRGEEEAPVAKRGRSRKDTTNAGEDGAETRQEAPKKHGRPRAENKEVREAAEEAPDAEQPAGKRKRRAPHEGEDGDQDELEGESAPKKRRSRRSLDKTPAEETQNSAPGPAARKKRGKAGAAQDADAPVEAEPKRKGRAKKSGGDDAADAEAPRTKGRPRRPDMAEADAGPSQPKKKGRPRRSDVSETAETAEPKKRGQPTRSDASNAAAEPPESKKRGRARRSDVSDQGGASQQRPTTARASRSPSPDAAPEEPQKKPYAYLAPKQRDIPVSTISATWTPLQAPSLAHARQTLHFSTRPVLQTLAPGPRRDAASSAIRAATKRLSNKLSKGLPFPPASRAAAKAASRAKVPRADGREAELDFESVAAEMEGLEGRLQPLLHSIEVLKGEERRMEKVLEREVEELEVLARNGREERKVWREGLRKKGHPLVPERWDPDGDGGDRLALAPREA
ncbi:MAG: hypothetical protein IMZ46_10030, partial [Acidobacteria bacterium]|nr:hypothetical protein [Acidobacteriota bacterium]